MFKTIEYTRGAIDALINEYFEGFRELPNECEFHFDLIEWTDSFKISLNWIKGQHIINHENEGPEVEPLEVNEYIIIKKHQKIKDLKTKLFNILETVNYD